MYNLIRVVVFEVKYKQNKKQNKNGTWRDKINKWVIACEINFLLSNRNTTFTLVLLFIFKKMQSKLLLEKI